MVMFWETLIYPQREFAPPGDPLGWYETEFMSAHEHLYRPDMQPVWPIEYRYLLEYFFYQMEPSLQVNPSYLEAWQNQAATLMPEYTSEEIYGPVHSFPYEFVQLSTPTFLPDGTPVTPPTTTKSSPGVGSGRTKTEPS